MNLLAACGLVVAVVAVMVWASGGHGVPRIAGCGESVVPALAARRRGDGSMTTEGGIEGSAGLKDLGAYSRRGKGPVGTPEQTMYPATRTLSDLDPRNPNGVVSRLLGVRELPERSDSALDAPTAPVSLTADFCDQCGAVAECDLMTDGRVLCLECQREMRLRSTDHSDCECRKCGGTDDL